MFNSMPKKPKQYEIKGNGKYLKNKPLVDLTPPAKVIWMFLMDNPSIPITMRDLSEILGFTPVTINTNIAALEKNNLVDRVERDGKRSTSFSYTARIPQGVTESLFEMNP
jgi:DNA-binding MarR family transcriptional regulator